MHFWKLLWDWDALDSVRAVHSFLEGWAIIFFALLVGFDVLAHLSGDNKAREKTLERIGLICFAIAVIAEGLAYPYSRRNDELSTQQDKEQKGEIAALNNSTQGLKTDAQRSKERSKKLETELQKERQKTARFQIAAAAAQLELTHKLIATGPRYRLLEAERHNLGVQLKSFSGQKVIIVNESGVSGLGFSEPAQTASVIEAMLREDANWAVQYRVARGSEAAGIAVQVSTEANARTREAGTLLIDLLAKILSPYFYVPRLPFPVDPRMLQVLSGEDGAMRLAILNPDSVVLSVGSRPDR